MKKRFLSLMVVLLSCLQIPAANYKISSIGIEQSLSNNFVTSLTMDKYGFLWVATDEGLNRFTGSKFFTYLNIKGNKQSLSSNELNCLLDDPKEPVMWIGTKNDGLNAYNYQTQEFRHYLHDDKDPSSLSTNDITFLSSSDDHHIWISTYWAGIQRMDTQTGKCVHYRKENTKGLIDNQFWCVRELGNGLVLGGHVLKGLSVIDTKNRSARNFQHSASNPSSISGNEVSTIYQDSNGVIWVGTENGLDIFNIATQAFIHIGTDVIRGHRVFDIQEMSDGKIWVGIEHLGIAVIDPQFNFFNTGTNMNVTVIGKGNNDYTLTGDNVFRLCGDAYHNVWVSVLGRGLNFLTSYLPPFMQLRYGPLMLENQLTEHSVQGLAIDHAGNLWMGTDGEGINVFSPDMKRIATYSQEVDKSIQSLYCDKKGNMWIGGYPGTAYVKKKNGGFLKLDLKGAQNINCFFENGNEMWVGTNYGICIIDKESLRLKQCLQQNSKLVRSIVKDKLGRFWVGYYDVGIKVFSPQLKEVASFYMDEKKKSLIPSNCINQLYVDDEGHVLAATNNGLVRFDVSDLKHSRIYNEADGLLNAHISAITEDDSHNIWLSTYSGISCWSHKTQKITNYSRKLNVVQANFNWASLARNTKGDVFFGSTEGVCYFSPKRLLNQETPPAPYISSIDLIRSEDLPDSMVNTIMQKKVELDYDDNSFKVNLGVHNYAVNQYIEYGYQLEGLQNEWISAEQSSVTFHNLPYGHYRLKVRSRICYGKWSDEIAELDIIIRPPFWLSWWAKLLYLLMITVLAWMGHRVYRRHLRLTYLLKAEKINHEKELELNQERMHFYTNITHELRTPLTLIVGPLEDLSHSSDIPGKIKHKLAMIHQSAVRLNDLITQILDFRKTEDKKLKLRVEQGNLVNTVHEVYLKYEELSRNPMVSFRFIAPDNTINMYYDKEIVGTIVDNLMSNAIKYTEKGNIEIRVERRRTEHHHLVDIIVSDTGHGISAEALPHIFERYYQENGAHQASGTGIGLSLVKNLVTVHQGEIDVKSSLEQGTTFTFTLDEDQIYADAIHRGNEQTVLEQESDSEETMDEETAENSQKPVLLVVEDNKDILSYIAESFDEEYEVVTAMDGRQGLAKALDRIPDMIISDIMMPNMDGNELCRTLKKDVRTCHIPIILLTAKDSLRDKEEGYDAGADSYITKPFTIALLKSRIQNIFMQRKRLLENINETKTTDFSEKKNQLRESLNKMDQEFFDKLNKVIEDNLTGDVDVNLLADKLAVSVSTLYRKMKALTGISTVEYIRKYKMQYAERLLLQGRYTINEISFMVGMNSIAYFRRCFKAEFGETPSDYLRRLKNE